MVHCALGVMLLDFSNTALLDYRSSDRFGRVANLLARSMCCEPLSLEGGFFVVSKDRIVVYQIQTL